MPGEELLINAALDALGISPAAYARERKNAEDYYNRAYEGLKSGVPLKDLGVDPKFVEKTLGPDYAAHLVGYEKGDAFKMANQDYSTRQQLKSAAEQYLSQPAAITALPEGMVGPPQPTAPDYQGYAARIASLSPEVKTLLFGPEVTQAGLSTQRQAFEQGPKFELASELGRRDAATGEQNAATAAGNLQQRKDEFGAEMDFRRAEGVRSKRANRDRDIQNASTVIASLYPSLTPPQLRKAALFHAGYGTEKSLRGVKLADGRSLADLPGVVRGAAGPGGPSANAVFQRANAAADWASDYIAKPENRKGWRKLSAEEQDGINNQRVTEAAIALTNYYRNFGGEVKPEQLVGALANRITVINTDGTVVPITDLPEAQQVAKLNVLARALDQTSGSGGAVDPFVQKYTQPGAAAAVTAPASPGPMTQSGAAPVPTPGVTNPTAVRGSNFSPPVVMPRPDRY